MGEVVRLESEPVAARDALKAMQERMMACTSLHMDPPVTHRFTNGIYSREIFIPKGCVIAGRIHKTEHISVISMGMVEVINDDLNTGEVTSHVYVAPCTFVSPAGTKRMVLAVEDTVWTTFHQYDGPRDEDAMIDIMSWPTYDDFEHYLISRQESPSTIEVKL